MPGHKGEPDAASRIQLLRWAMVGGALLGLMLLAVVALLALTLAQLRDSGGHIEAQDKKIAALFELGRPLAARADQLSGDIGPVIDDTRGLVAPLLRSDSGEDLATALDGLPLAESSVRRLAAEAIPLLDQADPALLMAMLSTVAGLAASLQQEDRLVRLIDGASAALVDVSEHDLVDRAAESAARIRKLLAVQRETRAIQTRTLRVQLRSLDVQRQSLEHIRSIDRKTGGELPPAPVP